MSSKIFSAFSNASSSSYAPIIITALCVIVAIVAVFVINGRYSASKKSSQNNKPTVALNTNIQSYIPQKTKSPATPTLGDHYILSAYNCCVKGPFNQGNVSISNMLNSIALGYRFLDFEIYSSSTDEPIVSCSTSNASCGSEPQSYDYVTFSDVMKYINMYAFSNSGCMNFNDPLIINLRIKSCNVNLLTSLAEIFNQYRNKLLGPEYSYNKNNSNFMKTYMTELMGKISIFVESEEIDYTSNKQFMEFVNSSKITGFLNVMSQSEFSNMQSLDDMIKYNKQNVTIIVPNPQEASPSNTVLQAYQYAGCQCVCMLLWQNDSYLSVNTDYFNKYKSAFVLKPDNLRYIPEIVPAPKQQLQQNSYKSRELNTGVAGIKYTI